MAKSNQDGLKSKHNIQLVGLFLWRFGLIVAGTTALYRAARFLLRFIDLPLQLEIGAGLIVTGFALFMISLVMERFADYRREGDLKR